jgi:alpha-1,6-mannosyltransferase
VRIVQVANLLPATTGSVEVVIDALGAEYVAGGHEVMVIRPGRRHHLAQVGPDLVRVELPSVVVPGSGGHRLFVRRAPVAALIASWRPDVIEVHDTTTLTWAGPLARRLGAIGVLCAHERVSWRARRAAAGFDLTVAAHRVGSPNSLVRRPTGGRLTEQFGNPATGAASVAVRVIPFGVDLEAFHPDRRHTVDRPAAPARVLLVGRLTRDHRPRLAALAVAELRWRGVDAELLAIGDGPERSELTGVTTGLRLLGHVDDRAHLAALLADADVVISTATRAGAGLSGLEALASGTPVVAVDDGPAAEVLTPGAGTTRHPEPGALADGLAAVLRGDRQAQRRVARLRAERFTWCAAATARLDAYAALGAARPSAA